MTRHENLLSPEAYMDLLLERRDVYEADHPPTVPWVRALPEWFIRDGDEHLVDVAAIKAQTPKLERRTPKPRTYRPASHWREELARIEARMDALDPGPRHGTTDSAAYGGIGIRQTARQNRQWGKRIDRTAAEWVRLDVRRREVSAKLARAEAREAKTS